MARKQNQRREVAIMSRVTWTERNKFARLAGKRGLSLSAWMRMSLLQQARETRAK